MITGLKAQAREIVKGLLVAKPRDSRQVCLEDTWLEDQMFYALVNELAEWAKTKKGINLVDYINFDFESAERGRSARPDTDYRRTILQLCLTTITACRR